MSAAIATKESVRAAALEFLRDPRRKLTIDEVMKILGGGSRTTVADTLREVRQELGVRGGNGEEPVPVHLATEADGLVKRLYAAAKDDARREYEAVVSRMSRIMVGVQEDSDAHAARAAHAQVRADRLQEELDAAKTMIDDLETQVLRGDEAKTLREASARAAQQDLDHAMS